MQNVNLPNRMHNLILAYDLCQLIDEPTHFTEQSSTIIDLALVNNPTNVLFSDVISPFVPNLGPPQGFWGSGEKGYLFSGSWGALLIILGELGSKHILLGI